MQTDKNFKFAGIDPCEVCNGLGFGVTLYVQGCSHHCEGCHNPSTWDHDGGEPFTPDVQIDLGKRLRDPNIRRFTVSGGEPFENLFGLQFGIAFKNTFPDKKLWVYTGYLYEELAQVEQFRMFFQYCDVLVDGPFILAERDITLPFRGSRNQRIIDIPATIIAGHIVELEVT